MYQILLTTLPLAYIRHEQMEPTLDRPFIYSEIVTHTTLELMTKFTDPSPAKQKAKIEAAVRSAEVRVLSGHPRH